MLKNSKKHNVKIYENFVILKIKDYLTMLMNEWTKTWQPYVKQST